MRSADFPQSSRASEIQCSCKILATAELPNKKTLTEFMFSRVICGDLTVITLELLLVLLLELPLERLQVQQLELPQVRQLELLLGLPLGLLKHREPRRQLLHEHRLLLLEVLMVLLELLLPFHSQLKPLKSRV